MANIYQSQFWANFCEKMHGFKPHYLSDGSLILKGYVGHLSFMHNPIMRTLSKWLAPTLWSIGLFPSEKNMNEIIALSRKEKAIYVRIEFADYNDEFKGWPAFSVRKKGTFVVDLTLPIETIWSNIKKTARNSVTKAKREGVAVKVVTTPEDFNRYYALLKQYKPYSLEWIKERTKEYTTIFLAEWRGKTVAGMSIYAYNNAMSELLVVNSDISAKKGLCAGELLMWEVIKWGHENGYRSFDLAGVSPDPKNKKEEGILFFKGKWGGRLVPFYICEKYFPENRFYYPFLIPFIKSSKKAYE